MPLTSVPVHTASLDGFGELLGEERLKLLRDRGRKISQLLAGRSVINVNSTGKGGGVAEMLGWMLGYVRGAGVDASWQVIEGTPEFFRITKRLHNMLHGDEGDGEGLDEEDGREYRRVSHHNAEELRAVVSAGDIVVLHDPQTAGLAGEMHDAGAKVIWRCHIGADARSDLTDRAWSFLREYVEAADALVFSREEAVPEWANRSRVTVIPPSIDPFSTKNRPMSGETARVILARTGILRTDGENAAPEFMRTDGTTGRVNHMADIVQTGPSPGPRDPMVVQVSRWDRLKDMAGVMEAFAAHVDSARESRLVLAGPVVTGVADDPEGGRVLTDCIERWRHLPHFERSRIQLVCLPMSDVHENAAIVNALQTHAMVVAQKSLQEGFGLTVTEAMWKGKPVVASAIGGIRDQVEDGKSGLLVQDPADHEEFGRAVQSLLGDPNYAARLGDAARERVRKNFLADRPLLQYADVLEQLVS